MKRIIASLLCGAALMPVAAVAQDQPTITSKGILKFPGFQLGELQPEGTFAMRVGSTFSTEGGGTGTQTYGGGLTWRPSGLPATVGFEIVAFDAPPNEPVNGTMANLTFAGLALNAEYALREGPQWSAAINASLGAMRYSQAGVSENDDFLMYRVAVPVTYRVSDGFAVTGALSATFGPEDFGTGAGIGQRYAAALGASYQVSERLEFYGMTKALFREGEQFDDGGGDQITTVGARYALTAELAIDAYATNAANDATILSDVLFFGGGGDLVIGANFEYRPSGAGPNAPRFRHGAGPVPVTLSFGDGYSVLSPEVIGADRARFIAGGHSGGGQIVGVTLASDPHWQYETHFEGYDLEDANAFRAGADEDLRFLIGGRWQALNEADGDGLSLGLHTLVGRDIEQPTVGVVYVSALAGKQLSDAIYGRVNLSAGLFSDDQVYGIGTGVTVGFSERLHGIFEYTYADGSSDVITAGVRCLPDWGNMAIDLFATNAAGQRGVGSIIGQDDFSIGLTVQMDTNFNVF